MGRPGVDVISRALPPPRSAPTDTGVAFLVGATTKGAAPALVHSLTEYENVFGTRSAAGATQATYDSADVYFREGGSQLWVSPVAAGALQEALDALSRDYGPGQVWIADPAVANVEANQSLLLAHAAATNRVALLSTPDDADATKLEAAGEALQTDANGRYGALFAPSAIVPGVVAGTTRTVPYAAVQAGIIARNDLSYTPNQPAAGVLGQAVYALDLANRYTDAEYESLNDAGVNMARIIYGGVRTYGYRSCADPVATPQWLMFGWCRLNMAIVADAEEIGERYVFSQLDGRRRTISAFGGDLSAMLAPFWEAGALYGDTPQDAYDVDVGIAVNTEDTIANGELHAILSVRMSAMSEWVQIEIVKVATNQALPATVTSVAA